MGAHVGRPTAIKLRDFMLSKRMSPLKKSMNFSKFHKSKRCFKTMRFQSFNGGGAILRGGLHEAHDDQLGGLIDVPAAMC